MACHCMIHFNIFCSTCGTSGRMCRIFLPGIFLPRRVFFPFFTTRSAAAPAKSHLRRDLVAVGNKLNLWHCRKKIKKLKKSKNLPNLVETLWRAAARDSSPLRAELMAGRCRAAVLHCTSQKRSVFPQQSSTFPLHIHVFTHRCLPRKY